jgi:hypothetical protein
MSVSPTLAFPIPTQTFYKAASNQFQSPGTTGSLASLSRDVKVTFPLGKHDMLPSSLLQAFPCQHIVFGISQCS